MRALDMLVKIEEQARDLAAANARIKELEENIARHCCFAERRNQLAIANERIAALEAERDAQETLLNELRALITRPRGTWTQVVGETVIRSSDEKTPEQP